MSNTKLRIFFFYAAFVLLLAAGCAGTKPLLQADRIPEAFVPAQHLVFIGLDGWGGAYVSKADMPAAKRMMSMGASSLKLQCVMPSKSWPNWTALFTGSPSEDNSLKDNPSLFTVTANAGSGKNKTAFFYEWKELRRICPDGKTEKYIIASDLESAEKAAAYIGENKPFFTAVVFNEPDSVGHNKRWGSSAYYNKLTELDSYIAIIEQAVKDAGIYDSTVFVLSADHGGVFWGHGFNSPKQRRIPLIVYGRGIKKGVIASPAGICDITPTMATILGLEAPPEWIGQTLYGIFENDIEP